MSSIQKRQLKTGPSWRVRYIDPDGREKSKSFRRKADAEKFATSIDHNLLAGTYVDPAAGRQTVKEYLEHWRASQPHRPRTAHGTKHRFEKMVYPHLGDKPIGTIKPSTIRTWQTTLAEHYEASTIQVVRGQLSGAFNDAVLDRLIPTNPCTPVKTPEIAYTELVPRTVAQVLAGTATLSNTRWQAVIPTAAGTGLRWSELFGLTRDRVDFLRKTLRVDRQLAGTDPDGNPTFGPPKSRRSIRTLPLPQTVIAALAAHLATYPAEPGQLIFRQPNDRPMTPEAWSKIWRAPRTAMGLEPGQGLHHLRHFYASVLIADGRNVKEVQERLGHASAQITLDTYGHLFPGTDDGTRNAIDNAFAANDESGATPKGDAASSEQ